VARRYTLIDPGFSHPVVDTPDLAWRRWSTLLVVAGEAEQVPWDARAIAEPLEDLQRRYSPYSSLKLAKVRLGHSDETAHAALAQPVQRRKIRTIAPMSRRRVRPLPLGRHGFR
jgi:hypothetical protein